MGTYGINELPKHCNKLEHIGMERGALRTLRIPTEKQLIKEYSTCNESDKQLWHQNPSTIR